VAPEALTLAMSGSPDALGVDIARRDGALPCEPVGIKLSALRPMIHLKCKKAVVNVAPASSSPTIMRRRVCSFAHL
jgi:hypothetical protein